MRFHFFFVCLLTGMVCSAFAQAPTSDFQTAKIIAVEKLDSKGNAASGTDTPLNSAVNNDNVSIQINDAVYVCHAKTPGDFDLAWAAGKEVQAKTKKNVMYVKRANGTVAKVNIISTKKSN